jgi:hypothetical protein
MLEDISFPWHFPGLMRINCFQLYLVLLELQQLQHWINLPLTTEGVDGFLTKQFNLLTNGAEATSATFTLYFVVAGGTLANPVNLNYYMTGLDIDGDGGA